MADDDVLDADGIAAKHFSAAFRGFDPNEVRAFLATLAAHVAALHEREQGLRARLTELEAGSRTPAPTSPEELEAAVGAETARVLHAAREAAAEIRAHAEENVARLLREAQDESATMRADASAALARKTEEAEAAAKGIVESAQQQGREMVAEAQAVRDRMLKDLARRRRQAETQLDALAALREQMVQAFDTASIAAAQATAALAAAAPVPMQSSPPADSEPEPAVDEVAVDVQVVEVVEVAAVVDDAPAAVVDDAIAGDELPKPAPHEDEPVSADEQPPAPAPSEDEPVADAPTAAPVLRAVPGGDERRSSSLRLLRRRPEPVADRPFDDDVESVRIIRPEPPAAVEATPEAPGDEGEEAGVDDLFARLRADRAAAVAEAEQILARPPSAPAAEAQPEPVVDAGADIGAVASHDGAFERRDAAVEDAERALVRSLKRALSDEQNEVLDALRRHRGRPVVEALLPDPAVHRARYSAVAADALAASAAAGAAVHGGAAPKVSALGDALADDVATDLRNRVARAIESGRDDDEALVEAVSAGYREWKAVRAEPFAHHHVAAAYAFGSYEAAPDGLLVWTVDPAEGSCPDCDDNALAGPTRKGDRYPTGQLHPPAHAGCRCLLVAPSH